MSNARILFAWLRPTPPFFLGGAEISHNILASKLSRMGYHVRSVGSYSNVVTGTNERRAQYLNCLGTLGTRCIETNADETISYEYRRIRCAMTPRDRFFALLRKEIDSGADVLITAQEESDSIVRLANEAGIKSVGWIHSVSPTGVLAIRGDPNVALCTSRFVLKAVRSTAMIDAELFYPPFEPYNGPASTGSAITMINPVPAKGLDLFRSIATRLSNRRFIGVEGWFDVRSALEHHQNVEYMNRQMKMDSVYSNTRVLLVPSQVEEGFGRVIVEAGMRGIPSVVSMKGGIAEALGDGGVMVCSSDLRDWIQAIESLDNDETYQTCSRAALRWSATFLRDPISELKRLHVLP